MPTWTCSAVRTTASCCAMLACRPKHSSAKPITVSASHATTGSSLGTVASSPSPTLSRLGVARLPDESVLLFVFRQAAAEEPSLLLRTLAQRTHPCIERIVLLGPPAKVLALELRRLKGGGAKRTGGRLARAALRVVGKIECEAGSGRVVPIAPTKSTSTFSDNLNKGKASPGTPLTQHPTSGVTENTAGADDDSRRKLGFTICDATTQQCCPRIATVEKPVALAE
eukprot:CAMPEP_0171832430 /NCGR_PEP_ID=MMETSP0992-20121227/9331_1 /TAXON_ID=483369 /ORGANISM="non described non described, Strain CCMP2098" /LENGTH=225 /DNA_ID=CAMNT_0012447957 /DNA_START=171 /DNA_END=850 /DNA_ORIENTATION=-